MYSKEVFVKKYFEILLRQDFTENSNKVDVFHSSLLTKILKVEYYLQITSEAIGQMATY